MVIDFCALNEKTIGDTYLFPNRDIRSVKEDEIF